MIELLPSSSEKLSRWKFNGEFGRKFSTIFDLQMWCLGCDIRRAEGNLLVRYGYERNRPVEGMPGSSHYLKQLDSAHQIHLWGFAIIVTSPLCGLCIKRHERTPIFARAPKLKTHLWRPQDLPSFSIPITGAERREARRLLSLCASELSKYETLVEEVESPLYRSRCLKGQRKGKKLLGFSLKDAWGELRVKLAMADSTFAINQ